MVAEKPDIDRLFLAGMWSTPGFVHHIGWISARSPFPTGEVPAGVLQRLNQFVASAAVSPKYMDIGPPDPPAVDCELCDPPLPAASRRVPRFEPFFCVPFANLLFVSPCLITHYITVHGYRPCDEYLEAVDTAPLPGSQAYADSVAAFRSRVCSSGGLWTGPGGRDWFEKGLCPICGTWIYSYRSAAPISTHHGRPLTQCSRNPDRRLNGVVVLIGAAGSGKTTIGLSLARRCSWAFVDADDLHTAATVAKICRGEPLTDADREQWLYAAHMTLLESSAVGEGAGVLACSALRESDRQRLTEGIAGLTLVYLHADRDLLVARLAARGTHFVPPSLLDGQLAALEEPTDALVVDAAQPVERIVDEIVAAVSRERGVG